MWLRLAVLWQCTEDEAKSKIDAVEFARWKAYHRIEPWGCWAEDVRHARLFHLLSCANAAKDHHPRVENAFPPWASESQQQRLQSPEEMRQHIRNWLGRK